MAQPQVKVVIVGSDGVHQGGTELLDAAQPTAGAWTWVDIGAPDQAVLDDLATRFGVPARVYARAVESLAAETVHPRYHPMPDGGWLLWRSPKRIVQDGTTSQLVSSTLHALIRDDLLVTLHRSESNGADRVKAEYGERVLKNGPWSALRVVLDTLAGEASPLLEDISDAIEAFENDILDDDRPPAKQQLAHLYDIRRILLEMQHDVGPDRDAIRSISRQMDRTNPIQRDYEDTGDQLGLLVEMIQTERDVASAAMDLYLSAQNNRMNEIMKQLTVVATIFMPLTLLSGIYGMNVAGLWPPTPGRIAIQYGAQNPDMYNWPFIVVVATMLVIAIAMGYWFRRKKWW